MAISIENLISEKNEVVTIPINETLETAVALMIEHDFSQLPVVENGLPYGNPAKFVTSDSISKALKMFQTKLTELKVRDALIPARTVSIDEDFFTKMDDLLDADAVLVLKSEGTIASIITNYDITQYFRKRAEDMLLVEDIETSLKDHIRAAYGGDTNESSPPLQKAINSLSSFVDNIQEDSRRSFKKFCYKNELNLSEEDLAEYVDGPFSKVKIDKTFDDLTLNEYIQLARKEEAWNVLSEHFSIPSIAFLSMLEGVRTTRNKLMHFRPDIRPVERAHLRTCAEWFKNHPPVFRDEDGSEELDSGLSQSQEIISTTDEKPEEGEIYLPEENSIEPSERRGDSKYAPLAAYLKKIPKNKERIKLSFETIETIIGNDLPTAARVHRAWWANETTHSQSQQWLDVNWRVMSINMTTEKVTFARARDREKAYIEFFNRVQNRLKDIPDFPLSMMNPLGVNWLTLAQFNDGKERLILSFAQRQRVRLEVYIDTGVESENNLIFNRLFNNRHTIENAIDGPIEWEPLENKRASRVALYRSGTIAAPPESLNDIVNWVADNAPKIYSAFLTFLY